MAFVPDPTLENGGISLGQAMTGTVGWFKDERAYGRITGGDGYIYFVHFSGIEMDGYKSPTEGQRVTFTWDGTRADHRRKAVTGVRPIWVRLSGFRNARRHRRLPDAEFSGPWRSRLAS